MSTLTPHRYEPAWPLQPEVCRIQGCGLPPSAEIHNVIEPSEKGASSPACVGGEHKSCAGRQEAQTQRRVPIALADAATAIPSSEPTIDSKPVCARCESNARNNEAGGYHDLATECRAYCRRGHRKSSISYPAEPEEPFGHCDTCGAILRQKEFCPKDPAHKIAIDGSAVNVPEVEQIQATARLRGSRRT